MSIKKFAKFTKKIIDFSKNLRAIIKARRGAVIRPMVPRYQILRTKPRFSLILYIMYKGKSN